RTAAFVGTQARGFVGAHRGFGRGFEVYRHEPHPPAPLEGLVGRMLHRIVLARLRHGVGAASGQVDAAARWLRAHADEPFLLFVHLYDVHSKSSGLPYDAPTPFRERTCPDLPASFDGCAAGRCASSRLHAAQEGEAPPPAADELAHVRCLYDAGVAYADAETGRLLDVLEAAGAAGRTLVVVTSDHGEAFLEHGHLLHTHLHEEVARIPLLVRGPGVRPGTRVATPVRLADVAPTVLALAGLPAPEGMDGPGLETALREGREPAPRAVHARGREALLRLGRFKLLAPRSPEARPAALYDLARDPGERENLLTDAPAAVRRRLEGALARLEAATSDADAPGAAQGVALSAADRRRLRALGYVVD
ncbi:MAG: sulfatase-like hydrolase/transferase, partial [Myxococcota bacterium]|nr:sulfatase-like hydrolase/transferase [Myxococcota bacterium]